MEQRSRVQVQSRPTEDIMYVYVLFHFLPAERRHESAIARVQIDEIKPVVPCGLHQRCITAKYPIHTQGTDKPWEGSPTMTKS